MGWLYCRAEPCSADATVVEHGSTLQGPIFHADRAAAAPHRPQSKECL